MKILLISPYSDIASIGLRIIAAMARNDGHDVIMAFLPHTPAEEVSVPDESQTYPESVLASLGDLAADCDLVGITVMTNYLYRAITLTRAVKRTGAVQVVWGGIHPTIRPKECLQNADFVITGEGEEAFVDLANALAESRDVTGIGNLHLMDEDKYTANPPRPLVQDLDRLPFPDYGPNLHYIWDREAGGLVPMDLTLLEKHLALGPISGIKHLVTYQTLATRGCPHRCAYCCNDVLQDMYTGQVHLRRRSNENVLLELTQIQKKYPFVEGIGFSDDSFFAASNDVIETFATEYRDTVNLPFFCLGSPVTITERKLKALLDAGMYGLQMGVQSGSTHIQDIYNRKISNKKVLETVNLLRRFSDRMVPPTYDFIIDSPWETNDDIIETLDLIRRFPRPYRLQLFSLVIFPDTGLYHRAVEEGIIKGDESQVYAHEYHIRQASYPNLVLGLYRHSIWKPILDFFSHPLVIRVLHRKSFNGIWSSVYRAGSWINRTLLKNQ